MLHNVAFHRSLHCLPRFCLFDLILYVPVNNLFSYIGGIFLRLTSTKQGSMCLAQGHNTVTPVRLEPAAPLSKVKHSTTEVPVCQDEIDLQRKKYNNFFLNYNP